MFLARLAGGPAGRQRRVAVVAAHEPPQREVRVDILARGRSGPVLDPLLDQLMGLQVRSGLHDGLCAEIHPTQGFRCNPQNACGSSVG